MLKFLSGRKRSRNALLILFIVILTVSLIGLFSVVVSGGGAGLFGSAGGSDTTIAKVGSYTITLKEYKDALAGFGQRIAQGQGRTGMQSLTTIHALYGQQVLDNLISEKLVMAEADRLGLTATDTEIESRIKQAFNPWPGPEQYRERLLQQAGMTPVQFETGVRSNITAEHVRSYITAAVQVSEQEIEDDYRHTNAKYSVRYADVDPSQFKDKVTFTDADLRTYFDAHKDDFKITSEQRHARYIFIDSAKAGETLQVADDELKASYNPESNLKSLRISQIVLDVPKASAKKADDKSESPEEAVRKKAQDLADRAKGGDGKTAEDFAKLARENSEDAKSKGSGGDIGWVDKDAKRDKDDPLNNAMNLKVGDVSQPIKKVDKYYIFKVTDRRLTTFEEAKPALLKQVRAQKGYSQAVTIANEAAARFKETKDAQAVVAEINKKNGTEVASVRDVPFFARGDSPIELSNTPEMEAAIFDLENPGDVGDSVNMNNGFGVPQYVERRDPHEAGFDEVKAKVEQSYRDDKAKQLAYDRAKQLAQAKTADELQALAKSLGVKVEDRAGAAETDSLGSLTSEETRAPIYKLNVGQVTTEPIKSDTGDHYVVAAIVDRKDADMGDAFQKEKKSIEQRLLDEKRNNYFSTYLAQIQQQMKDSGKIKIYQDRIETAMEATMTQPGAPAQPPGSPQRTRRPQRTAPSR